jgi:hypothetical protein
MGFPIKPKSGQETPSTAQDTTFAEEVNTESLSTKVTSKNLSSTQQEESFCNKVANESDTGEGTNQNVSAKTLDASGSAEKDGSRIGGRLHSETLDDITKQEQRERKAVKSDDAAVPESLWEEQLLKGLNTQQWDHKQLAKVCKVSTWLQSTMLRWWKRHVITSYFAWANTA